MIYIICAAAYFVWLCGGVYIAGRTKGEWEPFTTKGTVLMCAVLPPLAVIVWPVPLLVWIGRRGDRDREQWEKGAPPEDDKHTLLRGK